MYVATKPVLSVNILAADTSWSYMTRSLLTLVHNVWDSCGGFFFRSKGRRKCCKLLSVASIHKQSWGFCVGYASEHRIPYLLTSHKRKSHMVLLWAGVAGGTVNPSICILKKFIKQYIFWQQTVNMGSRFWKKNMNEVGNSLDRKKYILN